MIHVRTAVARRRRVVAPAVATAAVTALAWTASWARPADTIAVTVPARSPAVAGSFRAEALSIGCGCGGYRYGGCGYDGYGGQVRRWAEVRGASR